MAGPAEIAFVVRDDHQGRGLGSILLEHLAAAARERGVRRFEAEVLAENGQMVRVFRDAGYQVSRAFDEGVLHLEFDVDPTERSVEVRDAREQRAEARSVHNVLHPRSVAVIGASTDPTKLGHAVLLHLLRGNFAGPVYPVNPDARSVRGVRAYASVTDIPDEVDLAVVAVPAAGTGDVMDSCLAKGVRALVVLSSGYAALDAGGAGADAAAARRRLAEEARAHGMRVVGPNALGVANTDPQVRLNATLAPDCPARAASGSSASRVPWASRCWPRATERGLGLSTFVSAGNRADLSGNDMLQYWQTDPATDVVLLYLETFGNPRKFARLTRRLARSKPVVAVRSGRLPGPGAATGPADEAGVQALFEQSGVIRVQNVTQMFDAAQLLAYQPLPAGGRVAVVGNSTALNLLAVDALLGQGLELAGAPVDAGTTVGPAELGAAVAAAGAGGDVDALVVVFVPPLAMSGAAHAHAQALREAVPAWTSRWSPRSSAPRASPRGSRCPGPGFPGPRLGAELPDAGACGGRSGPGHPLRPVAHRAGGGVRAAGRDRRAGRPHTVENALVRGRGPDEGPAPAAAPPGAATSTAAPPAAAAARHRTRRTRRGPLRQERIALLRCYGIDVLAFRRATSPAATVAAARELGFPVAIKAAEERWRHRADGAGCDSTSSPTRAPGRRSPTSRAPRAATRCSCSGWVRPAPHAPSRWSTTRRSARCCRSACPAWPASCSATAPTACSRCRPSTPRTSSGRRVRRRCSRGTAAPRPRGSTRSRTSRCG